jgi:hypothetical protein
MTTTTTLTPKSNDVATLSIVGLLLLLLFAGGTGGGVAAPFSTPVPAVLNIFDSSPAGTQDMDNNHPGQAEVISSSAEGSARQWVEQQGGLWENYGSKEPEPDGKMAGTWYYDAWKYWKDHADGKVPYTVASGPKGRGYAGPTPDGQAAAKKALAPIAK